MTLSPRSKLESFNSELEAAVCKYVGHVANYACPLLSLTGTGSVKHCNHMEATCIYAARGMLETKCKLSGQEVIF